MNEKNLYDLISKGENISIEFKSCQKDLNKDVFETVCSFLNRNGGHLFLGVEDSGEISGIDNNNIKKIIDNFITSVNNPQKIFPPVYLYPQILIIKNKYIIYIFVPESSQVHNHKGQIFDRNDHGDINISKNYSLISDLYLRKQTFYSENTIYPFAQINDFRMDLIEYVIEQANRNFNTLKNHPWKNLNHMDFLKSSQLFKKDFKTGKEGFTLASILLFGKDETILNVLPFYRTDAILRSNNIERYDDRDDIRTNLIETYTRLISFVKKHLPDPFFLEKDIRISLRDIIFREAVSNFIIHREFTNAYPAKMIIEKNKVLFENSNRPHGFGDITPTNFTPYPKNPLIARVFKEIGLVDELGSGVRNLFKYTKNYSNGNNPIMIEADIFKLIIPFKNFTEQATAEVTEQAIINFCKSPKSATEIMEFMNLKHREHFRKEILLPLLEKELLFMTVPDKPKSPKQKYCSIKYF